MFVSTDKAEATCTIKSMNHCSSAHHFNHSLQKKSTQKPPVSKLKQSVLLNPSKTSPTKGAKAKKEANHGVTVLNERVLQCGVKLTVASGDITQLPCNAVIIPSDANFGLGGQVG
jgi:hypothetical protein